MRAIASKVRKVRTKFYDIFEKQNMSQYAQLSVQKLCASFLRLLLAHGKVLVVSHALQPGGTPGDARPGLPTTLLIQLSVASWRWVCGLSRCGCAGEGDRRTRE